jgi:hypothetical protein
VAEDLRVKGNISFYYKWYKWFYIITNRSDSEPVWQCTNW